LIIGILTSIMNTLGDSCRLVFISVA